MLKGNSLSILISLILAVSTQALAERLRFEDFQRGKQELSLFLAEAESHRIPRKTTDLTAFRLLKLRCGSFVSPREEYAIELALAQEEERPENDGLFIVGCYRRFLAVRRSAAVAFDVGFGVVCFEKRLIAHSTRINFTEHLGISLHLATGSNTAVTLGYVFSHNSNAGLRLPNLGINASIWNIGVSWYR